MADTPMQMNAETQVTQSAKPTPIVPPSNIAGQALSLVIAIMSFLACLTVGAVLMIDRSASAWQSQISREATIQIRPARDFDIETALMEAQAIAAGFEGVVNARIIDLPQTANLLEPWLGTGIDLAELPVPRLVVIRIDERNPPDFKAIGAAISEAIPNATMDDHRAWVDRLVSMARTTTFVGVAILALVLTALVLTVVFATRGALASNHVIIEVLHFVGARANFIAGQFQRRFFWIGLRGAVIGGGGAILLFLIFQFWAQRNLTTAQGEQVAVLFGDFSIGMGTFIGALLVIALVATLTTLTARLTVIRTIYEIDEQRADPSRQFY
ncbi:cell division protein FtsX [Ahrensia marina]|uniref:Cell division protein FtsX n=1 Tax=Ahrensia marina TaxID=1514904 RepID=A0A0N0E6G9_9HYPH|nr:ABC transporter permease [Ahrensia marina]KPB00015.1 cell division protein FtsX [Ahrensia marina]